MKKKKLDINNKNLFVVVINPSNKNSFFNELKLEGIRVKVYPIAPNPKVNLNVISFGLEIKEEDEKNLEEARYSLDRLQLRFLR